MAGSTARKWEVLNIKNTSVHVVGTQKNQVTSASVQQSGATKHSAPSSTFYLSGSDFGLIWGTADLTVASEAVCRLWWRGLHFRTFAIVVFEIFS